MKILPFQAQEIIVTENCNLNCKYCFVKENKKVSFNKEFIDEFLKNPVGLKFYPFGGEVLLESDLLFYFIDKIKASNDINPAYKNSLLKSLKYIITNGTVFTDELVKKIKNEGGFNFQISLDGPKHVHDKNRVDFSGKGSFDRIKEGIEKLNKNNIEWSVHGVLNKDTIQYLFDFVRFIFLLEVENRGVERAIQNLSQNYLQIVFEDDYDDNDIDILLEQFFKVTEWIYKSEELNFLTEEQRMTALKNFMFRTGGICSAGATFVSYTCNYNILPCHRLSDKYHKEFILGNLNDEKREFFNYKGFNLFINVYKNKTMYSSHLIIDNGNFPSWANWCPATNVESGNSIFLRPSKHDTLNAELVFFIQKLSERYKINLSVKNKEKEPWE